MSILAPLRHHTKRDKFVAEVRAYHADSAPAATAPAPRRTLVPDAGRIGLAELLAADLATVAVIRDTAPRTVQAPPIAVTPDPVANAIMRNLGYIQGRIDAAPFLRHEDKIRAGLAKIAAMLAEVA